MPRSSEALQRLAGRCVSLVASLSILSVVIAGLTPGLAQNSPQAGSDVTVLVLQDDFEGPFPGANWTVADANATAGFDYWSSSAYRNATGNRSVWSAGSGNQTILWQADTIFPANNTSVILLEDDFENGSFGANWTAYDNDATSGDDYWGPSGWRVHSGSTSIWSAQVGYNDALGDDNFNLSSYDDYMDAQMWTAVNFTGVSNDSFVILDFWYWLDSETFYDYLYAVYDNGSGPVGVFQSDGISSGWQQASVPIAPDATSIGFVFVSDSSNVFEGAYIDDVVIRAAPPLPKTGPFTEDFEGGSTAPYWRGLDVDPLAGIDTWDVSTARAHTGTSSLWCAQIGDNSELGGTNVANSAYDDSMDTWIWRDLNSTGLGNFSSVRLSFWYWLDSEQGYDYFEIWYLSAGQWNLVNSLDGTTNGWLQLSYALPNDTTQVAFAFTSDESVVQEGVYIDDIQFTASRPEPNTVLRTYDAFMNSTMTRAVSVSQYASASLEYSYWLATDSPNDTLEAMYLLGGNWTYVDGHTGNTSGWQSSNISIPVGASRVGFRFITDADGRAEGAYIDSLRLWGTYYPLNCTANVSSLIGVENATSFAFLGNASDGLRPYSWSWSFSDGTNSSLQVVPRIFTGAGSYAADMTVRDSAGQVCTAQVGPIDVAHDTSVIDVSPVITSVVEGDSAELSAADRNGHPLAVSWGLPDTSCGYLSASGVASAVYHFSADAGGIDCTVIATFGPTERRFVVSVLHNLSAVTISPPSASLVEGGTLSVSAVDAAGHGLNFAWSTTCGQVSLTAAPSTTFTAPATGGSLCTLRATLGTGSASMDVTITHDTARLTVGPSSAIIVEGAERSFSVFDAHSHEISADWALTPAACGNLSATTGSTTVLSVSTAQGGMACTVTASIGATVSSAAVSVIHDTSQVSIAPKTATLAGGLSLSFQVLDAFSHALNVSWAVGPSTCGDMVPAEGVASTFTSRITAAGTSCIVTAAASGVTQSATVAVTNGLPARVNVTASAAEAPEGGTVTFGSVIYDAAGHVLGGIVRSWSATCGLLESTVGSANSLVLPQDGAGTSCTVTASNGSVSGSATISVRHARPFTVQVTSVPPTTTAGASSYALVAKVTDAFGHEIPNATVQWSATCGALSSAAGPSTTFTAPPEGGKACEVTATTQDGGSPSEGSMVITAPASLDLLPILVIVALAAAAGVALLLVRRRRKPAQAPAPSPPPAR